MGRVIDSFLAELASGVVPVPGLELVTMVVLDLDGKVILMH